MDAITYFMVNYGLYSLLLIVPAALLGAGLGWFTWGKYRAGELESRQRLEEAEQVTEEAEIALSKERERIKGVPGKFLRFRKNNCGPAGG